MASTLKPERNVAVVRLQEVLDSEHWLGNYVSVLLSCWELTGSVDFSTARELLDTEEKEFQRDLEVARRMYNLYPDLVANQRCEAPTAAAFPADRSIVQS